MDDNKPKPILGEMISNFPAEALKKAMLHLDRFDDAVVTDERIQAVEAEKQLEDVSNKIIEDNL